VSRISLIVAAAASIAGGCGRGASASDPDAEAAEVGHPADRGTDGQEDAGSGDREPAFDGGAADGPIGADSANGDAKSAATKCRSDCKPGACQPTPLVSGLLSPRGIAQDATSIYFTNFNADTVMKVAKAGGPPAIIVPRRFPSEQPYGIAVAASRVFWAAYFRSYIASVGLDGEGLIMLVPNGAGYATDVLADEASVYWVMPGGVAKVSREGGPVSGVVKGHPNGIALDPRNLYWTRSSASGGAIMKADLDGGNAIELAMNLVSPGAVALDDANVYAIDDGGGSVVKVSKAGGPVTTLATGQAARTLAVDASGVYWTDGAGGSVRRVGLEGGPVSMLASGQKMPTRLVVDACHLYWLDEEAGTVMQVSK